MTACRRGWCVAPLFDTSSGSEIGLLAGLGLMGDITLGDRLTAGLGPSFQLVTLGSGDLVLGPRASVGVHLLPGRGSDGVRRTSLFLAAEVDVLFGAADPLAAPALLLGYEAY